MARRSETPYLSPPVVMIYKLSTSRRSKSPDLLLFAHKTTNVRITFNFTNCGTLLIVSELSLS